MSLVQDWLSEIWGTLVHQFNHMTLPMALWLGLLLLTLLLLVLMSTRWGGVKPIWKCVILSVWAHILLGGYAYGTKLIFKGPPRPVSETVTLKIVENESPASDGFAKATTQANPWDHLDLAPDLSPASDSAKRLSPTVEKTVARTTPQVRPQKSDPLVPRQRSISKNENVPRPLPETKRNEPPPTPPQKSITQASEIEFQRQRRAEASGFTAPELTDAQSAARMDPLNNRSIQKMNQRSKPAPLAEQTADPAELLTQLAGINSAEKEPKILEKLDQPNPTGANSEPALDWSKPQMPASPFRMASDSKPTVAPESVPEIYSGRTAEERQRAAAQFGGSPQTERAVDLALKWLAEHQETTGAWNGLKYGAGQERLVLGHDRKGAGTSADCGLTGLSLLAFLAAGHTHLDGDYQDTVQRGLEYLLRNQANNGEIAGEAKLFARMYCHAMATLAITETYAMTSDERLEPFVQRAVKYSLDSQHESLGGWRYRPGDEGDMSQFGWQVLVMKSAELAGIEISIRDKALMRVFLDRCTSGDYAGLASYRPGLVPTATMTAEALVCRYFLEDQVAPQTANEAGQLILQEMPGNAEENLYYWYYGTLAMFQTGGSAWDHWNHQLTQTLVGSQLQEGQQMGSWEPTGVWAGYGGRVYSTAMATLCLEVYYRYQTR